MADLIFANPAWHDRVRATHTAQTCVHAYRHAPQTTSACGDAAQLRLKERAEYLSALSSAENAVAWALPVCPHERAERVCVSVGNGGRGVY